MRKPKKCHKKILRKFISERRICRISFRSGFWRCSSSRSWNSFNHLGSKKMHSNFSSSIQLLSWTFFSLSTTSWDAFLANLKSNVKNTRDHPKFFDFSKIIEALNVCFKEVKFTSKIHFEKRWRPPKVIFPNNNTLVLLLLSCSDAIIIGHESTNKYHLKGGAVHLLDSKAKTNLRLPPLRWNWYASLSTDWRFASSSSPTTTVQTSIQNVL